MISPSLSAVMEFLRPNSVSTQNTDRMLVDRIRDQARQLRNSSAAELSHVATDLRTQFQSQGSSGQQDVLVSTFAAVCEAARRVLTIELYDAQLLGGLALARGTIAEMQTGEGKTFAAMLPAAYHALAGEGVHVMTVNPYLAERDSQMLAPVYRMLGFSIGLTTADVNLQDKRTAYASDITYGPGYEFGFDYLRDQVQMLAQPKRQLGDAFRGRLRGQAMDTANTMQRGQAVAIVDEADSVMIDEAMTPLILSAGGNEPAWNAHVYQAALKSARRLVPLRHFSVDVRTAAVGLTPEGDNRISSDRREFPNSGLERPWSEYVIQALRAEHIFRRDVDYTVMDDQVRIVDQYTGRVFSDRSWSDGLQQAVQAKEGVTITNETRPIARITRQRYLRLYKHLCGMTGTAQGCANELKDVYRLNVTVIPTHKPCRRSRWPNRLFVDRPTKEAAIVGEIERLYATGRPVLVGTLAIESSERLAVLLEKKEIPFQLLNGKQDQQEAAVIANAGQRGTVTIATNMAGRGTDIKLGPGVAELGGLHVIATEPHDSTRVDRQLAGRAARQGALGSFQLFTCSDDLLYTRYAPAISHELRRAAALQVETQVETGQPSIDKKIAKIQVQVEREQARRRRQIFSRDDWLESIARELT